MEVITVTKDNFAEEVLKSSLPVLIDFNADWCGPCKMVGPILNELASESDDYKIVSINVDKEEELSNTYGVISIPCLVVFENGKEVKREVGFKSKDDIKSLLGV